MENFAAILVFLGIGSVLRKVSAFPANTGLVLNQYVLYVVMPAVILLKIPELVISSSLLLPAIIPWLLLGVVLTLILIVAKVFKWEKSTTVALLIVLPLGNTSFLGFPMVEAFFGQNTLPYAIIYDQAGSFLALATYATILAAVHNPEAQTPSIKAIVKRVATFPAFIALIIALLFKQYEYPALLTTILSSVSATLIPVIMIAVGFQFDVKLSAQEFKPLLFAIPVKLLLMPLIALGVITCFDVSVELKNAVVFEAAMPVMISAGAIAIGANLAPKMTSALVAISLLISFLTLPVWYWILTS
ncbi:Possible malate permease [Pseudoalteromonas luteoviolacea B = ATCC 29581]|nr:Possible malate permease [Pseudoalteromonas luteoviolacea B = ATCC 29581]